MAGVAPIRLGLVGPPWPGSSRGLADEDGVAEPRHEGMEPLGVPGGLHANCDRPWERAVELLNSVAIVSELPVENFAGAGVKDGDLLLTRMPITFNECHNPGLLCVGAVALGLAEASSSVGPFS